MEKLKVSKSWKVRRHISAGTIIYRKTRKEIEILLLYRKNSETWHLPKGTVERDQSLAETALRETKEETGFDVKLNGYIGKLESLIEREEKIIPKDTHYYLAEVIPGTVTRVDKEHDGATFVTLEKALVVLNFDTIAEKEYEIVRLATKQLQTFLV